MLLSGKATFLEARSINQKDGDKLTFAVFGFAEDFDRREVIVPKDKISMLPINDNKPCTVTFQINKRFDGKEDIRLVACKE